MSKLFKNVQIMLMKPVFLCKKKSVELILRTRYISLFLNTFSFMCVTDTHFCHFVTLYSFPYRDDVPKILTTLISSMSIF